MIQTVCGPIEPGELGFCHSHEHIMLAKGRPFLVDESQCMDDYEKSLAELGLFKSVGGSAIVDCQPVGAGRMAAELKALSKQSGVHIVASTGFHKAMFYEKGHWVFVTDEEHLRELFLHELTVGMYVDTEQGLYEDFCNSRAGVIKVAYDIVGLDSHYTRLFAAAAAAQVKTGAPMVIHIDNGADPLVVDKFLDERGIAPKKRIYCHLDRAVADVSVHIELCRRGCFVEYDTICRPKYHDDAAEIDIIRRVIDAGYADRILLGMDSTNKRLKAYGGEIGLDYIKNVFLPKMENNGISSELTDAFMTMNPMRAFNMREEH